MEEKKNPGFSTVIGLHSGDGFKHHINANGSRDTIGSDLENHPLQSKTEGGAERVGVIG